MRRLAWTVRVMDIEIQTDTVLECVRDHMRTYQPCSRMYSFDGLHNYESRQSGDGGPEFNTMLFRSMRRNITTLKS